MVVTTRVGFYAPMDAPLASLSCFFQAAPWTGSDKPIIFHQHLYRIGLAGIEQLNRAWASRFRAAGRRTRSFVAQAGRFPSAKANSYFLPCSFEDSLFRCLAAETRQHSDAAEAATRSRRAEKQVSTKENDIKIDKLHQNLLLDEFSVLVKLLPGAISSQTWDCVVHLRILQMSRYHISTTSQALPGRVSPAGSVATPAKSDPMLLQTMKTKTLHLFSSARPKCITKQRTTTQPSPSLTR